MNRFLPLLVVVVAALGLGGCAATIRPVAAVTDVPPLGPTAQIVLTDGRIVPAPDLRAAPDSIRWTGGDGVEASVPTCAVVELRRDERYGSPPQARTGALAGAALGAVGAVALVLTVVTRTEPPASGAERVVEGVIGLGVGVPMFAFAGALFGGLAGAATAPVERYPLDRVPCPIGPAPGAGSRPQLR